MSAKPITITVPIERRYEAIVAMARAVEKLASALDCPPAVVHVSGCQFTGVAPAISISPLGPLASETETRVVPVEHEEEDGRESGQDSRRENEEGKPE